MTISRDHLAHVRGDSSWAVDEFAKTLDDRRTCLLCFERDHRACHRDLIAGELRARGADLIVRHL